MSMFDAIRKMPEGWMAPSEDEPIQAPIPLTVVEEIEAVVRMASVSDASVDSHSQTWAAVCKWAATQLLEIYTRQGGADGRANLLKELLALDRPERAARFVDERPHIP